MAFLQQALTCSVCGKTMGLVAGVRGLGLRQRGHESRCRARAIRREREDKNEDVDSEGEVGELAEQIHEISYDCQNEENIPELCWKARQEPTPENSHPESIFKSEEGIRTNDHIRFEDRVLEVEFNPEDAIKPTVDADRKRYCVPPIAGWNTLKCVPPIAGWKTLKSCRSARAESADSALLKSSRSARAGSVDSTPLKSSRSARAVSVQWELDTIGMAVAPSEQFCSDTRMAQRCSFKLSRRPSLKLCTGIVAAALRRTDKS